MSNPSNPTLVKRADGSEIIPGQLIDDFRGTTWTFRQLIEGRNGFFKIIVTPLKIADNAQLQREFYPQVFPGVVVRTDGDK